MRFGKSMWAVGIAALSGLTLPAAAQQTAEPGLPIAEGVWVETRTACNAATGVYVYRGNRFGDVYFWTDNGRMMGPGVNMDTITSVRQLRGGWTEFGWIDGDVESHKQVMPLPSGQIVLRSVGYDGPASGPGRYGEISRETLRRCPVEQLLPQMRAAVTPVLNVTASDRRLAPAPAPVSAPPAPPALSGNLPIPVGYYAVGTSCAEALQYRSGVMITQTHFTDIADRFVLDVRNLGGGRYRLARDLFTIRVTGPRTFVAEEGSPNQQNYTWCAATEPR